MPALRSTLRTHPLATLGLLAIFLVSAIQWLRDAGDRIDELFHGERLVSAPFDIDLFTYKVTYIDPSLQAAGLIKGDQVLSVNGRALEGLTDFYGPVRRARLGDRLSVHVRRFTPAGPTELDVSVPLKQFTYVGFPQGSMQYPFVLTLRMATPFLCMLLGFWVAAVRVYDPAAWNLLFVMLSVANLITEGRTILGTEDSLQPFLTAFSIGLIRLGPIVLAYFGITFPEPLPFDARHPWIKWVLLGPMLARGAVIAVNDGLILHHHALSLKLEPVFHLVESGPAVSLELAAIAIFFLSLLYKTFTELNPDARRRLLLLDTAAVAGLLPLVVTIIVCVMLDIPFQGWYAAVSMGTLVIFPVAMAYVILVHRALDVRAVVRQGVQYLLAAGTIRVLQVVMTAAIIVTVATMSANTSVPRRITFISIGFVLLIRLRALAQWLQRWIDRRFFREAYEADAILSDLAAKVRTMIETGPLLETVASRIASALHVPRVAILLDGGGAFRAAYALGYGAIPAASLSDRSLTLRRLSKAQHALVEFDNADSWVQLADREERAALEELKPELLLPLSLNDRMLGIMSLGPKRSEEPFSKADIRLLDSVAAQTGLALENGRLTDAIRAEAAAREKHNRELELAREVQERLFPQDYPRVPGLDYAGACRPALGVGGDYYDFIPVSDGLAIAIGDVSGKGIPAALLMATLRAFLRGQTIDHQTDLTAVIARLNHLVYESSAHNRYATFFCGVLDSSSRVLKYVNAGHNAPMLFRSAAPIRLEEGGSVVGLMRDGTWSQGHVQLEAGDLMVMFTDGVSEALNAREEEWEEEGLIAAVQSARSAPAQAILERIMKAADQFVAGAPQYDDMTLIVMRIG